MKLFQSSSSSLCFLFLSYFIVRSEGRGKDSSSPNIVVILVDDIGWNDFSYNTNNLSLIHTPFIDELSSRGIRLKNHYVQTTCTPTVNTLIFLLISLHFVTPYLLTYQPKLIESKSFNWEICCKHWFNLCDVTWITCWFTKKYSNYATTIKRSRI